MRAAHIASILAFGLASQPALADGPGPGPKGACRADIEKHCKSVTPGEGRIAKCVKAHRHEFSEPCRAALKKARERRQAAKAKTQ